jgi:hypothetical protein
LDGGKREEFEFFEMEGEGFFEGDLVHEEGFALEVAGLIHAGSFAAGEAKADESAVRKEDHQGVREGLLEGFCDGLKVFFCPIVALEGNREKQTGGHQREAVLGSKGREVEIISIELKEEVNAFPRGEIKLCKSGAVGCFCLHKGSEGLGLCGEVLEDSRGAITEVCPEGECGVVGLSCGKAPKDG